MIIDILYKIAANPNSTEFRPLGQLLKRLRPRKPQDAEQAAVHLHTLIRLLDEHPELLITLQQYVRGLLKNRRHIHLYVDTGILGSETVGQGIMRRIGERLLPPIRDDNFLDDAFARLIRNGRDSEWITMIDNATWANLISRLLAGTADKITSAHCRYEQLDALRVLAHRISAMSLESEFVRNHPAVEAFESPFMALSIETDRFVRHQREQLQGIREDSIDHRQMLVLMDQCKEVIRKARRQASVNGVSVSLTYLLVRLQQSLQRIDTMLSFLTVEHKDLPLEITRFFKLMANAEQDDHSIRALFSRNTELLARNITEHAGHRGEHYVTNTPKGYFAMLHSASRAGFIVAFMALFKVFATRLSLAPIAQAFVYSMNYSLGFMLIHVLHGTVATKQPAMTASHIAACIEGVSDDRKAIKNIGLLANLCVDVFRTQFIAIMGNVSIAFPIAIAIGFISIGLSGNSPASAAKAEVLLHDLSPIHSLAIFHAAIAGVCLFLSGIIAGYYDNKSIYSRVPQRIAQHRLLYWVRANKRKRIELYLRNNLGALAGNFYFGLMLGSMGTIGFILGLPIDIRHIAFATANLAYALVGLNFVIPLDVLLLSIAGVIAIGLANLGVSFSLALMLALKSRGVRFRLWWPLLLAIMSHFRQAPRDFFWPPKQTAAALEDKKNAS
jgi:site-specific recombinase